MARELVARRARREPLQYVLGEWGFRRLTLTVDRRALIPRPETEILVERALALRRRARRGRACSTSAPAPVRSRSRSRTSIRVRVVTGLDSSPDALALAAENVARTGLAVELARHDLFDGTARRPVGSVVSNPPYVDAADLPGLEPEVRDWEPHGALSADGAVEAVARGAVAVLASGRGARARGRSRADRGDGRACSRSSASSTSG